MNGEVILSICAILTLLIFAVGVVLVILNRKDLKRVVRVLGVCVFLMMMSAIHLQIFSRISGYESTFLLSQYIGDFHPDAHVNGFSGLNITALMSRRDLATAFSIASIVLFYFQSSSTYICVRIRQS